MTDEPSQEDRRRAVCTAMSAAPGLIRYATRFTRSLADAEDAYQRAMEIALTRAPVTEPARFMAWLRVVLRNEAIAVAGLRHREGPQAVEDTAALADGIPHGDPSPSARAEWRERYLMLQDALERLTEPQRICVLLQASGASYALIGVITGYSRRKVERSILEGRAALTRLELAIGAGEACASLGDAIDRVVAGIADTRERRRVARHVRHCRACRATMRGRGQANEGLAALVPVALLIGAGGHASPPDPGPALAWFERVGAGATVRMGQVMQVALDAPGSVAAKVGAGAALAAVAGTAGLPLVTGGTSGAQPAAVTLPIAATARALALLQPPAMADPGAAAPATSGSSLRQRATAPRLSRAQLERVAALAARPRPSAAASHAPLAARVMTSHPTAVRPPAIGGRASADLSGARGISVGPGAP